MIKLTDEEIDGLWTEYEERDPHQETDWDVILIKAQAKKDINSVEKIGGEIMSLGDLNMSRGSLVRGLFIPEHKWQALKKEVENE